MRVKVDEDLPQAVVELLGAGAGGMGVMTRLTLRFVPAVSKSTS
jgi:hypothetical protein